MSGDTACERCGQAAFPEPVHVENTQHHLCRSCFADFTAEYLTAHEEQAADLAGKLQLPWPSTGAGELARILVAGLEQTRAEMRARFGEPGAT